MRAIVDDRVQKVGDKFRAQCKCGKVRPFATKAGALKMLHRGSCNNCRRDYRSVKDHEHGVYRREDGKWCSRCSGCDCEQAYTRKDHAKQSSAADWQCRKCVAKSKGFSNNLPVGDMRRLFNKFKKGARDRGIGWHVSFEQFEECYTGKCALTGWEINTSYEDCNASFDRISSDGDYAIGNVQWVHSMVNLCKNKYDEAKFIEMCKSVASFRETL